MRPPFPIVPVKKREEVMGGVDREENTKQNREGVMLSLKCPLLSASNILPSNDYLQVRLCHPRRGGWRVKGGWEVLVGGERYSRPPQVGAEERRSVNTTALHRASPYTPRTHPAPRHTVFFSPFFFPGEAQGLPE